MNKNALIVFVKNPELGRVKTRLARTLGDKEALEVYKTLLHHTSKITKSTFYDRFIFYSNYVDIQDMFFGNGTYKEVQKGEDLGSKMSNAFSTVFSNKYEKVVIIGSDCYELTNDIITESYQLLSKSDTVIGPAKDGGYYLLGMKKLTPELFTNIDWSTDIVLPTTIKRIEKNKESFELLPTLSDIDYESDWLKAKEIVRES